MGARQQRVAAVAAPLRRRPPRMRDSKGMAEPCGSHVARATPLHSKDQFSIVGVQAEQPSRRAVVAIAAAALFHHSFVAQHWSAAAAAAAATEAAACELQRAASGLMWCDLEQGDGPPPIKGAFYKCV